MGTILVDNLGKYVTTNTMYPPEGFDTFLAKELHFIIPIGNGPFPVGGSALPTLLVDV